MSGAAPATTDRALRRLFLALFLRGRGARGFNRDEAPGSIARKLWLTLGINAALGCMALAFVSMPVFVMSLYMHALTFMMLGMFVASSAGEVLFNKEEAEILMHRPVLPTSLLRAKMLVMLQVAAWISGALNLVTLGVGTFGPSGNLLFLPAHMISVLASALFAIGLVVATYQLGTKWIGRDRLDNLLTTVQVLISVTFLVGLQVLPRMMERFPATVALTSETWWLMLVPPAWFASIDQVLTGSVSAGTVTLAATGVAGTAGIVYLASVTLAGAFGTGLQRAQDVAAPSAGRGERRRLHSLVKRPPLSWWLSDPVSRASFLLVSAYMFRDREVKLRLYPGIAPVLVFPVIFLVGSGARSTSGGGFGLAFSSIYLCVVPLAALNLLEFSQHWQAADVFRVAPIDGPGRILHGARRAVMLFLALPSLVAVVLLSVLLARNVEQWPVMLPGLIALPVFAMIGSAVGTPVPLSRPLDQAKSAGRGMTQILIMVGAFTMGFITLAAWRAGHIWTLVGMESVLAVGAYIMTRQLLNDARWRQ